MQVISRKEKQNPSLAWLLVADILIVHAYRGTLLVDSPVECKSGVRLCPWGRWSCISSPLEPAYSCLWGSSPPLPKNVEPAFSSSMRSLFSCLLKSPGLYPSPLQATLHLPIKLSIFNRLGFSWKKAGGRVGGRAERWSKELDSMIRSAARLVLCGR